jgi:multicomponent Na+:H+ antiporter subunit A
MTSPLTVLLLAHAAVAVVCLAPGTRSARWGLWAAALPLAVTFAWLLWVAPSVLDGEVRSVSLTWVPQLGADLSMRLDGFAWLMGLVVSGIGTLVLLYATRYFGARPDLGRLAGLLVAFAGAMLGLVWSDGFFTLFLFWELTSVTSFLLIGIDDRSAAARVAAVRAFLVTGTGGLALLGGLVVLGRVSGTTRISELVADPPTGALATAGLVLVLMGAFAKSAQFPLHFWLPGAMAAPTPVSAYLHSATMVKAGLVLVARLAPAFGDVPAWRVLVVAAGGTSLLLGGVRALRQVDAKLALAHGTVSQLGLLMVLLGLGTPATTYAGVAVLCAHALFKASLFLTVGVVDHQAGTRDLRRLTGLGRRLPALAAVGLAAAASMAAVPPTFGFVAKEYGLDALLHLDGAWAGLTVAVVVTGSALTVAYTVRIWVGLFGRPLGPGRGSDRGGAVERPELVDAARVARPSVALVAAPALLALLSVVFGIAAGPVGHELSAATDSLVPDDGHLVLWPGLKTALGLSVLTWVAGGLLATAVLRRERALVPAAGLAERAYAWCYDGLLRGARRLTAVTQSGSLPAYVLVVMSTVVAALAVALAGRGWRSALDAPVATNWARTVLAALTAMLALGVLRARRRFTAALLVGGAGYGLAALFLLRGAPDLAVTQFLVETLTIVLFLVVLTRLPDRFEASPSWAPRLVRVALSVAVGVVVAGFALAASAARTAPSIGADMVARAESEAGGRNVVNVILVDFRGLDTLGEITVLAVAAIGVVNLVGAARRAQRERRLADGTDLPAPAPERSR